MRTDDGWRGSTNHRDLVGGSTFEGAYDAKCDKPKAGGGPGGGGVQIDDVPSGNSLDQDEDGCTDGYDQCLDPESLDYDCAGGSGDGPDYVDGPVYVDGDDPFALDDDEDDEGCES